MLSFWEESGLQNGAVLGFWGESDPQNCVMLGFWGESGPQNGVVFTNMHVKLKLPQHDALSSLSSKLKLKLKLSI